MIKSITITNHLNESIKLELTAPEKSGFAVLSIGGLGPSIANINMSNSATIDGSMYNSAKVASRNIVMRLKLLENASIEDTRQLSYKYFPIKKRVKLVIETDNRLSETYGYIESNEPVIFSNNVETQISIICPDPYLYSSGKDGTTVTIFSGIEPLFTFPFSNGSLTENLLFFGEITSKVIRTIYYTGGAEIGVVITIKALDVATDISIYNVQTRELMVIDTSKIEDLTGFGIIAGDEIVISTVKGDKYITLLREGEYTNILNCVSKDADWFQLSKGDNLFTYTAVTGDTNLQFKIENQTLYEGV